jgi:hypothetical protein
VAFVEETIRDPKLPGLRIRVYRSGRKVFFLVYRFAREKRRLKLGLYSPPGFGLAAARLMAGSKLASITKGEDPAGEATKARRADDVRGLYEEFEKEVVAKFPPKTRANWKGTSGRLLSEVGSLPVTATDEICDRIMALHKRVGLQEGKETLAHTIFKHASRLFRWAVEERRVKASQFPLSGMPSRFSDKKRTRYYDPDEDPESVGSHQRSGHLVAGGRQTGLGPSQQLSESRLGGPNPGYRWGITRVGPCATSVTVWHDGRVVASVSFHSSAAVKLPWLLLIRAGGRMRFFTSPTLGGEVACRRSSGSRPRNVHPLW